MGSGSSTLNGGLRIPSNINYGFTLNSYTANSPPGTNKRALLIGCNYVGINGVNSLNGCINDTNLIKSLIEPWGFSITMMNDYSTGNLYPTKTNILDNITNLIGLTQSGDTLIIQFSGHGGLVSDSPGGDEGSFGKDSVILSLDPSLVYDDEIRSRLTSAVAGANIFLIFDSCNSGSMCDLRYCCFDTSYREMPGNKNSEIITRTVNTVNTNYSNTNANIVSISGSKDTELSSEIVVNGVPGGALTYAIYATLGRLTPVISFATFLQNVRSTINNDFGIYTQVPVLMCGNSSFNTNENLNTFMKI